MVSVSDEGETRVRDMYVVSAPVPGRMRRIDLEAGDTVVADKTVIARIEPSDPASLDVRSAAEARASVDAAAASRTHAAAQVRRAQAELEFAQSELAAHPDTGSQPHGFRERPRFGGAQGQDCRRSARRGPRRTAGPRIGVPGRACPADDAGLTHSHRGLRLRDGLLTRQRRRTARRDRERGRRAVGDADPGDRRPRQAGGRRGPALGGRRTGAARPARGHRGLGRFGTARRRRASRRALRIHEGVGARHRRAARQRDHRHQGAAPAVAAPRSRLSRRAAHRALGGPRRAQGAPLGPLPPGPEVGRVRRRRRPAVLREVEIGHENGLEAEVTSGLEAGERIVLHPGDRVAPGARLEERN